MKQSGGQLVGFTSPFPPPPVIPLKHSDGSSARAVSITNGTPHSGVKSFDLTCIIIKKQKATSLIVLHGRASYKKYLLESFVHSAYSLVKVITYINMAHFHRTILMTPLAILLLLVPLTEATIALTPAEEECLRQTGTLFEGNNDLIAARHNYATSMQTEMTSSLTMTAKYPDDKLREYDALCSANGGFLHTIKIDFFDCKLGNMQKDVELTLKNFANCLANTEACMNFDQENLLEEAWEDLGLHCELEEGPGDKPLDPRARDDDAPIVMDDDLAHQEEKAAAEGADDVDRTEKASEYIPKEEQGKRKKKKGSAGKFFTNVLLLGIIGTAGYMVYERKFNSRRLPWGGVTTSRFQQRGEGPTGFVSNYQMLSGDDEINFAGEHELQLQQV